MEFTYYIFVVLLSLSPAHLDEETWKEREARMTTIAYAIDAAASKATCSDKYKSVPCQRTWPGSKKDLALLLVTMGWWESKFAKNVHEGNCRDWECDPHKVGGHIFHRARTPWQIQRTGFLEGDEWHEMMGTGLKATTIAAVVATRVLAHGRKRCSTNLGAMATFGGMETCTWAAVVPRLQWWEKLRAKKDEELKELIQIQKRRVREKEEVTDEKVAKQE